MLVRDSCILLGILITSYICSRRCPEFLLVSLRMNICTYICRLIFKSGRKRFFKIFQSTEKGGCAFWRAAISAWRYPKVLENISTYICDGTVFQHNSILIFPTYFKKFFFNSAINFRNNKSIVEFKIPHLRYRYLTIDS